MEIDYTVIGGFVVLTILVSIQYSLNTIIKLLREIKEKNRR